MQCEKVRTAKFGDHTAAILHDMFARIVRARPAIERSVNSLRYAALSAEETVSDAGRIRKIGSAKNQHFIFLVVAPNAGNPIRFCAYGKQKPSEEPGDDRY